MPSLNSPAADWRDGVGSATLGRVVPPIPPFQVLRLHFTVLEELSQARRDKGGWRALVPGRSVECDSRHEEAAHPFQYRAFDADGTLVAEGTTHDGEIDLDGAGSRGPAWMAALECHQIGEGATSLELTHRGTGAVTRPVG